MPSPLLFAALLGLQDPTPPAPKPGAAGEARTEPKAEAPKPLSFASGTHAYVWNALIPLRVEVDGLRVQSIFFNEREPRPRLLRGMKWGHRAHLEVTNTSTHPRTPGFAVAVFDAEGNLLGAASGGTKIGTVKPGETETFDLNFYQVKQRLQRGAKFVLSVELRD